MITYVDLFFPSGGPTAGEIAEKLKQEAGLQFIRGSHDVCFRWEGFDEFSQWIEKVHAVLQGTGVMYRFTSMEEEEKRAEDMVGWPPARLPDKPVSRRDR